MRRLTMMVILVAFGFSCGAQWPLLQCVAWGNMIREYSTEVPLAQAVEMTFSGHYPCAMCKAIAEKKESENNRLATLFHHEKKIASHPFFTARRMAVAGPQTFVVREQFFQTRSEAPPVPPPRCA